MKAVLSNMGFVMQMSGIFILIPIILSFVYKENAATIALFITATLFFALGFLLNALCERKELNFKESSSLIVLVFILLSIIGAIPYLYLGINDGSLMQRVTNSIFESASGFTTTGFSVIPDLSAIPKSIIFYRSLTQFLGGLGIVLVLLAFFYPSDKLEEFSRSMGFMKNGKIKKMLVIVLMIYFIYSLLLTGICFALGYKDIISLVSLIFSALSSGGFTPTNQLSVPYPINYGLVIGMILGASNFIVIAKLAKFRFRQFFQSEIPVLLTIIFGAFLAVKCLFNLSYFDSLFHIVSASTTTGFQYLPLAEMSDSLKLFLTFLMFIGGTSLSTAGGIKIYRFILIFKSFKKAIHDSITREDRPIKQFGCEYTNSDVINALAIIILTIALAFVSALILTYYGFGLVDSLFEATSAIATTGLTVGIVTPAIALELKWLFITLMILGRVEIIAFFIMLSRARQSKT